MRGTKSAFTISVIFLFIVSGLASCGGGGKGSDNGTNTNDSGNPSTYTTADFNAVIGAGVEDISAQDYADVFSGGSGFEAAPVVSGFEPAPILVRDDRLWWLLLNPTRRHLRDEAREVLEAPSALAFYLVKAYYLNPRLLPDCVTVRQDPGCPLIPNHMGSTCHINIAFAPGCQLTISGKTLELAGELDRVSSVIVPATSPDVWDGVWEVANIAGNFTVTDPTSTRSMTYDGLLTETGDGTSAAYPYDRHYSWLIDPDNNPITLTDSVGGVFTTNGTRDLYVNPGDSVYLNVDTYPTMTPAGRSSLQLHRELTKTMKLQAASMVELGINGKLTYVTAHKVWRRSGSYTLHGLDSNPVTKVEANGTGTLTNPDGKLLTVQLQDVVYNKVNWVPESGMFIVTFPDGTVYTYTFTGTCTLSWVSSKGTSGTLDYCSWDSYQQ